MTISPQDHAQVPMNPSDVYDGYDGLDEFDSSDLVTPRISILHREGQFRDSLTNQVYPSLNVIILGLVKQRILWPERQANGDMPMCKSNDHRTGYVNLSLMQKPSDKQFPWNRSNFDPSKQTLDPEGRLPLPCEGCELKEWGSHPDGNKPFCAEMFTLPVMYDPMSRGEYVPALISFQKTQLKSLRAYLSAFQRQQTPPFQVVTRMGLTIENANTQSPYSVPNFAMGEQTDPQMWRTYADHWKSMSGFLRVPPRKDEAPKEQAAPSNNQWGQQAAQPQADPMNPWAGAQSPGQPAWGQQPPQTIPGQVNPQQFQQPQQAPVQQAPVQQAAPQEPLPQQAPVQQAQPAPPPFQQAAPEPAPVAPEPVQEAPAAPVSDASPIVGGWATQVAANPQEAAPAQSEPAPAPVEQPAAEQPVQQAPVEQPAATAPGQGAQLPF